jgi:phosphomannomutase
MGNAMAEHEAQGHTVLFSYEEAIGFCCGTVTRDKDGVSAAAVFAEMANYYWREQGLTVAQLLESLYKVSCAYGAPSCNNSHADRELMQFAYKSHCSGTATL